MEKKSVPNKTCQIPITLTKCIISTKIKKKKLEGIKFAFKRLWKVETLVSICQCDRPVTLEGVH